MASKPAHDIAGMGAGAVMAAIAASDQMPLHQLLEAFGGGVGGLGGSRMPDILDPPLSPSHRDVAHGVLPVGTVLAAVWEAIPAYQRELRKYADSLASKRNAPDSMTEFARLLNFLLECACRILAGTLVGLPSGYVSHLALDACTARGLPLIAAGL